MKFRYRVGCALAFLGAVVASGAMTIWNLVYDIQKPGDHRHFFMCFCVACVGIAIMMLGTAIAKTQVQREVELARSEAAAAQAELERVNETAPE